MKLMQKLIVSLLTFLLGISLFNPSFFAAQNVDINAKSALSIDASTGQILYQQNSQQKLAIASMSKLLTTYMVIKKIRQHELAWNDQVTISKSIAKLSTQPELTNVELKAGQKYSIKSLVDASLVASANAAAVALGEKVAGNSQEFAKAMQKTAKSLGIRNADLYNAAGVTNEQMGDLRSKATAKDAENMMSAQDISIVAAKLLKLFPKIVKITKQPNIKFAGVIYPGHNQLLAESDLEVDGLKTGTSDKAGGNFVGTAHQNNHRIITVVMGAGNQSSSDPSRFIETKKLLTYSYQNFMRYQFEPNQKITTVPVKDGKQAKVDVAFLHPTNLWLPNHASLDDISTQLDLKSGGKQVLAPIKRNQILGIGQMQTKKFKPIYVDAIKPKMTVKSLSDVKKQNIFVIGYNRIVDWLKSL